MSFFFRLIALLGLFLLGACARQEDNSDEPSLLFLGAACSGASVPVYLDLDASGPLGLADFSPGAGDFIVLSRVFARSYNQAAPGVGDFVVAHECAHIEAGHLVSLGGSAQREEVEADTMATQSLVRQGKAQAVRAAIAWLSATPDVPSEQSEDDGHLSHAQRALYLQRVLAAQL